MNAPADVLAQVARELHKECSCVVGGPNHGQCLNCDLSDRIETARAAECRLIQHWFRLFSIVAQNADVIAVHGWTHPDEINAALDSITDAYGEAAVERATKVQP